LLVPTVTRARARVQGLPLNVSNVSNLLPKTADFQGLQHE